MLLSESLLHVVLAGKAKAVLREAASAGDLRGKADKSTFRENRASDCDDVNDGHRRQRICTITGVILTNMQMKARMPIYLVTEDHHHNNDDRLPRSVGETFSSEGLAPLPEHHPKPDLSSIDRI